MWIFVVSFGFYINLMLMIGFVINLIFKKLLIGLIGDINEVIVWWIIIIYIYNIWLVVFMGVGDCCYDIVWF